MSLADLLPQLHAASQRAYAALPRALGDGRALPPLRLAFVVTHRCNLKCSWCMVTKDTTRLSWRAAEELAPGEIERVARQTTPWCMITLTGGEPFVRRDLGEIVERVARIRPTHLVTNGTLAGEAEARWLVALGAAPWGKGVVTVGVSVEGPPQVHDRVVGMPHASHKAMAFIRHLLEERRRKGRRFPLVDLKVVLSKDNWDLLGAFRRDMAAEGVDLVSVQIQNNQASAYGIPSTDTMAHAHLPPPVDPIPFGPLLEVLRELASEGRRGPGRVRFAPPLPLEAVAAHYGGNLTPSMLQCHATWTTAHVGPYGHVFPCFSYPMGSVREADLPSIWNGPAYRRFRQMVRRARAFPGCVGCCMASPRAHEGHGAGGARHGGEGESGPPG